MQTTAARSQVVSPLAGDLSGFVRYLLSRCGGDYLQAIEDRGLSLSQIKALHVLAEAAEDVSLKGLGDKLGLSMPAISRAVDGLVQRRLVTRTEDRLDRRIKRVRVTAAGRDVVDELVQLRLAEIEEFLTTLSTRERDRLRAALAPIMAREDVAAMRPRGER